MDVSLPSLQNHKIATVFFEQVGYGFIVNLDVGKVEVRGLLIKQLLSSVVDNTFVLGPVISEVSEHSVGLARSRDSIKDNTCVVALLEIVHMRLNRLSVHTKVIFLGSKNLVESVDSFVPFESYKKNKFTGS